MLAHYWWHHVTHRHTLLTKEGLGELVVCGHRFSSRVTAFWYRPSLDDAGWHQVPEDRYQAVVSAADAFEAMTILRREPG